MLYQIPLVLTPQPEGGFTVTSPLLPELVTEGDTMAEVYANVQDALQAVVEAYEDLGCPLPASLRLSDSQKARFGWKPLWRPHEIPGNFPQINRTRLSGVAPPRGRFPPKMV